MHMRASRCAVLLAGCLAWLVAGSALAGAADGDAAALLEKTGLKGGLCLVVGAKDPSLAAALAAKSTLYVQVLQPDAKLAAAWGAEFAKNDFADREKLGLRSAAFDAEHYGTDLFNLIVVEDAAALGKAKLADLCRILVPNGCVAFKSAPEGFAAEAGGLKMAALGAGAFPAVFRKPVLPPPEWKVCDSVKWKAGAGGLGECADITVKDGTLAYADRFENEGDLTVPAGRYIVRDAYNGRTLRSEPLGARKPEWYAPRVAAALKPIKPEPAKPWEERGQGGGYKAVKERTDGKLDLPFFGGHCYRPVQLGKYVVYHHNIWLNTETNERTYPHFVHPACAYGLVPGNAMVYNFPSSKPQIISGITALAPADVAFDHEPGGKIRQTFGAAPQGAPAAADDWPMFRANPARGNSCTAAPGDKPVKAWEVQLGPGAKSYGVMSGERTGLTQPVSAWGLVVVADIDSERIVALDAADGKQKWAFHVGSRVDFPPTLYNGLCLFAAKNGWVHCLDARTGAPVWKLQIAPRERYIGWQEKLGNLWPVRCDVPVVNGVGYVAAGLGFTVLGGVRVVGFKAETGEPVWSQCYHEELGAGERQLTADLFTWGNWRGRSIMKMGGCTIDAATGAKSPDVQGGLAGNFDGYLDIGNSLPRTMADTSGYLMGDSRARGRVFAADGELSVAHAVAWGGVSWESHGEGRNKGKPMPMNLFAKKDAQAKEPLWKSPDIELVADDIVLTPQRIYCVGHYQRVKKDAELWVIAREDGKVISTVPVDGYPAFMGTSAAGKRLFIATREGKLICYEGK
jgi:outer membrane protein assembly factor BamB